MKSKISFYNYTFLTLSVLMLIFCIYSLYTKPTDYVIDFKVIDTKSIAKLEPKFLKEHDEKAPLPEPEPMYESEDNGIISCGGWSERIVFNAAELQKKDLLQKVDKAIDSIRLNDLERRAHINIVLHQKTPYQTFIDILDLFEKKNSMIYGVHKDLVYWIEYFYSMKTLLYIILALLIAFGVFYLVDPFFSDTLSILIVTIVITVFAGFYRKFENRL